MQAVPRTEYPRPDLVRSDWESLNGEWEFAFDDENMGVTQRWFTGMQKLPQIINVPFAYQTELSGIHTSEHHPIVWYARDFAVPTAWNSRRVLLHFGAVDYEAVVWVNGTYVGEHRGGYVPFHFDITDLLQTGANRLVVRVRDEVRLDQPRGKQTARQGQWGCWYTPVTGIWQSVWLEPVAAIHFTELHLIPDIDTESLDMRLRFSGATAGMTIEAVATSEGQPVVTQEAAIPLHYKRWSDVRPEHQAHFTLPVRAPKLWSPKSPFLYDLTLRLKVNGVVQDEVHTYFGMRKVHAENGQVFLNNAPFYQKLVLDQGFWPDGLYTAPTVEAIKRDVELTKAMGFNGARKHQKIEDPYYYYYCDQLGLVVWSEMPATFEYDEEAANNLRREWTEAVRRDRNHPSIIAWTPLNESWGVDQIGHAKRPEIIAYMQELYYLTKSLDATRLVIGNDGWQHALTDLLTVHEYTQDAADLSRRLQAFLNDYHMAVFSHNRPTLLPEFTVAGAPVLVTEFGGTRIAAQGADGWGYGRAVGDYDEWLQRIKQLVDAIRTQSAIVGYCYTQLTDVQQEVNGLLTFNHEPKVEVERINAVFGGRL